VSRPYNGCDMGLNLNLPEKLREMGVIALPLDFLPLDGRKVSRDFPYMYWKSGQRILASARYIRSQDKVHGLYVTNFGCGPDSFIGKFFEREMKGKPFLTIEIDEHSADGGVLTRCEAFLDSLRNVRGKETEAEVVPAAPKAYVPVRERNRVLCIPHMDDHGRILAAAMRYHGVPARAMPKSNEESLVIGQRFTTGRECYPCIITTGDIVRETQAQDFDPRAAAFLMPAATGPCRFGQYHRFHRMVLDDLGLVDVPIYVLDQQQGFNESVAGMGSALRRRAWQGFVVVDLLQKMARSTRPYEVRRGETDGVYWRCLERLEEAVEAGRDVGALGPSFRDAFDAIPADRGRVKPRIGIVGEIYVRCNEFANNFIVRKLEALGAEVALPPLEEWLDYIDFERREDFRLAWNWRGLLVEHAKEWVKRRDVRRLSRPFDGALRDFRLEEPTGEVIRRAGRYLAPAVRGEAVLSMGRACEYAEHGFHGIVNVAPFNCIPGTIVNALLRKFVADHANMPCLKMQYDGHEEAGEDLRLEAFVHQARQAASRRKHADGEPHERKGLEVRR